jgi:hypothetical protein
MPNNYNFEINLSDDERFFQVEEMNSGTKSKFYPVHSVAFLWIDGKLYEFVTCQSDFIAGIPAC